MKTNKYTAFILLAIIVIVGVSACGATTEVDTADGVPVSVIDNSIVSATGILTPETYAYLSMANYGRVEEILVHEGQLVPKGQSLISISSLTQTEVILAGAEFEYEAAKQALDTLNETAELVKASTWLNLLDAKAQYIVAESAWDNLDKDALEDDIENAGDEVLDAEEENYNEKVRVRDALIIQLEIAEARWRAAQEVLDLAQTEYDATLDGPDVDQLALAEAGLEAAIKQKEAALEQIENLILTAPFAGVITETRINEGEWASPGQPVILLADLDSLRVKTTDLNEIDVINIEVGYLTEITFDAIPDEVFSGEIIEISIKATDGLGVNYTVVIELDEIPDGARWGMTVFVDIDTNQ